MTLLLLLKPKPWMWPEGGESYGFPVYIHKEEVQAKSESLTEQVLHQAKIGSIEGIQKLAEQVALQDYDLKTQILTDLFDKALRLNEEIQNLKNILDQEAYQIAVEAKKRTFQFLTMLLIAMTMDD